MPRPDPDALIRAARACLGTPFHHQGRCPGAGLDCAGLIVHAARSCAMEIIDQTDYPLLPPEGPLRESLCKHGLREVADTPLPGDILLFRFGRDARHLALATDAGRMIHAYAPAGQVVETALTEAWQRRLTGVWRFN